MKRKEIPTISNYGFLKMFLAGLILKEKTSINKEEIEISLYKLSSYQEFEYLFEDIEKNKENKKINLDNAFKIAIFSKILIQNDDEYFINLNIDEAQKILDTSNNSDAFNIIRMINLMNNQNIQVRTRNINR